MSEQSTPVACGGQLVCRQCNITFSLRKYNQKFCCVICGKRWWNQNRTPQKPNVSFACKVCGKWVEKYVEPSRLDGSNGDRLEYCSLKCKGVGLSGANHPLWNGGRTLVNGYWWVYQPDHPHAKSKGYVLEQRLVMEAYLGRYLDPVEVVHHRNDIKTDNRLENLRLYASNSEHKRDDIVFRKRDEAGRLLPKEV